MKRIFIAVVVLLIAVLGGVVDSQAQLGAGVKIPPLVLPNVFIAYHLSDTQLIEVMGSIQSVQFASSITLGANLKQYLNALYVQEAPLMPFLGAGATVTAANVNVLGQASSSMALAVSGLAGVEYAINDSPFSVFFEFIPSVVVTPIFGFHIGGAIGVRFDF